MKDSTASSGKRGGPSDLKGSTHSSQADSAKWNHSGYD